MNNVNKQTELINAVENDFVLQAKRLLDEGADINVSNEDNLPLLVIAIKNGASKEMIELLLDEGADISWKTEEGVTLSDEAVERNRVDLVKLFIERGLDPAETSRKSGMTTFMLAACFDYIEMMELLLEHGADLYAVDESGMSALDYARKLGRKRSHKWIEDKMANPF